MSKEAATTAEISVCVKGDQGTSATHKLEDENVLLFQTSEEDWFIMAETKSLGRLKELTVWVDYSNTAPSWWVASDASHILQHKGLTFVCIEYIVQTWVSLLMIWTQTMREWVCYDTDANSRW